MIKPVNIVAAAALCAGSAGIAAAQNAAPIVTLVDTAATAQYGGEWQPGPGWDRDIDVRCASGNFQYNMCQVDTGRGSRVYVSRQISKTSCIEGRTWGWNRAGVWVDGGCEAVFTIDRRWR